MSEAEKAETQMPESHGQRPNSQHAHPRRRMIGAYGDTGRPFTQARQSQLGAPHGARFPLSPLNSNCE
jgi:hypothetical protein